MNKNRILQFFLLLITLQPIVLLAEITVNIVGGINRTIPIAILPFEKEINQPLKFRAESIIEKNLLRSGFFNTVNVKMLTAKNPDESLNYKYYRALGADYVLTGKIIQLSQNYYTLKVALFDIILNRKEWLYEWQFKNDSLRLSAHRISDLAFEQITGRESGFSSLIAYIQVEQERNNQRIYKLQVADSDGYDPHTVVTSNMPILSPAWASDSKNIAYVSFENGRSEIFTHNIYESKRKKIASYRGINSAPAWSPDGKSLAMTLSLHGDPEIYIVTLKNNLLRRITRSKGIDTEPVFSSDGEYIYFTSDRRGKPQIFRKRLKGNARPELIAGKGAYNAGASLSKDSNYLAIVHSNGDGLKLALHDIERNETVPITSTFLDDSPSLSPGGNMLIYSAVDRQSGQGNLIMIDLRGQTKQILKSAKGEVKDAAWGPIRKQFFQNDK